LIRLGEVHPHIRSMLPASIQAALERQQARGLSADEDQWEDDEEQSL
jgi:hypothetical protein